MVPVAMLNQIWDFEGEDEAHVLLERFWRVLTNLVFIDALPF